MVSAAVGMQYAEAAGRETDCTAGTGPNFVIIIADDMGYSDIGCYGNGYIRTPAIDSMAGKGMMFTDAHSNSALSTPTRAALMTGRYQQYSGLEGVILENVGEHKSAGLPADRVTFAKVLSDNGYETCLLGKWHLGSAPEYNPCNFGFGTFKGFLTGNVDYFSRVNNNGVSDWWDGREPDRAEGYTTDILTDEAVSYIRANKSRPFCLVISESCPHGPLQGPDDYALRLEGQKPVTLKIRNKRQSEIYRSMIEDLDRGVGRILRELQACGIEDRTLVLFTSDNGPKLRIGTGSAAPFRGGKGSMFEGGHRVPFIAYMPGTVPAGTANQSVIMGFDIFPTLLEMAGIVYDDTSAPLDGTSLLSALKGGEIHSRTLYWALGNKKAVREGSWKYVEQKIRSDGKVKTEKYLFDLNTDREESANLVGLYPDIAERLGGKLTLWYENVTSEHREQLVQYIPSMNF